MPIACSRMRHVAMGIVLGLILSWGGSPGIATAALITFYFEGNVNAVTSQLTPDFTLSDRFRGSYSFNSLTPDGNLSPRIGDYTLANASFTLGGHTYSMGGGVAGDLSVVIGNANLDPGRTIDSYTVAFTPVGPSSTNGLIPSKFSLRIAGVNHFPDDSLPLTPPSLSGLSHNVIRFDMGTVAQLTHGVVGGEITSLSLTAVPVPGAVLLFGSGLIGLAAFGRRRLKKHS